MKSSLQLRILAAAGLVSLVALGLTMGANGLLKKRNSPPGAAVRQASPAAVSAGNPPDTSANSPSVQAGRSLFLKNCAHCHGDDARGDEGPDLHGLSRSDEWIARRIRNGVKGEMTAFGEKFSQPDIDAIVAYLRTLR